MSLLELPHETKEHIFKFCRPKDLCNFSLCGKKAYNDVKNVLWSQMTLNWHRLDEQRPYIEGTNHFALLTSIHFKYFGNGAVRRHGDGTQNMNRFKDIVNHCNPDRLKTLSFSCYLIPKGLKVASSHLKLVTELNLCCINLLPAFWKEIYSFKLIRSLKLVFCNITEANVKDLWKFSQLSRIAVICCGKLSWASIEYMRLLPNLAKLVFRGSSSDKVQEESCPPISSAGSLEHLELCCNYPNDSFFDSVLSELRNVRFLSLSGLSNKSMISISRFKALVSLKIFDSNITCSGLDIFVELENLDALELFSCKNITDQGLLNISKSRSVTKLELKGLPLITDKGVEYISSLPLTFLEIRCEKLTDDCFWFLARMKNLETLIMRHCAGLTGTGLKHLTKLQKLKSADFRFCYNMDEDLVMNGEGFGKVDIRWQREGRMLPYWTSHIGRTTGPM